MKKTTKNNNYSLQHKIISNTKAIQNKYIKESVYVEIWLGRRFSYTVCIVCFNNHLYC